MAMRVLCDRVMIWVLQLVEVHVCAKAVSPSAHWAQIGGNTVFLLQC